MHTRDIAIGIMAKAPVPGLCKTRMVPPLDATAAAALHEAMLRDTVDRVRATGVQAMLLAAPEGDGVSILARMFPDLRVLPQEGADLGQRMSRALDVLWASGARHAALVGTDAPHAPFEGLLDACRADVDVVMGPATDGGYWTLALSRPAPALLENMPWSTGDVARLTRERSSASGLRMVEVATVTDVDDASSLAEARAALLASAPRTRAWLARMPVS